MPTIVAALHYAAQVLRLAGGIAELARARREPTRRLTAAREALTQEQLGAGYVRLRLEHALGKHFEKGTQDYDVAFQHFPQQQ